MNPTNIIIIILSLSNTLVVKGLLTDDGKFENGKNYIKFNDNNDNLNNLSHPEENHRYPVKFTDEITEIDDENFNRDHDTKITNINVKNGDKNANNLVVFEDNKELQNIGNNSNNVVKKRRRRKRRPRNQAVKEDYGFVNQGGLEGQNYYGLERPKRRKRLPRKPSLTEQASSTFINALTSISLYDDQQCIPKLLCDTTAGRKGGFSGGSMLQGFIDLQPLMTLLLAYNGATASPLISFGRAIILGMSSSQYNPYICQKSYPLCPSDPDKLVHYLNNHNGGFFRFFNNPLNQQQQSLNQFLGHLSNAPPGFDQNLQVPQKFGSQQHYNQLGYPLNHLVNDQQTLYPYSPSLSQNGYGILQPQNYVNNKFSQNKYKNHKGDLDKQLIDNQSNIQFRSIDQDLTKDDGKRDEISSKNYVPNTNSINDDSIKISRRILTSSHDDEEKQEEDYNKPIEAFEDIPKWLLPLNDEIIQKQPIHNKRKIKTLLFPDEIYTLTNIEDTINPNLHQATAEYRPPVNINTNDKNNRGFVFPGYNIYKSDQDNSNRFKTYNYNRIQNKINVKYVSDNLNNVRHDDLETVYVVRGNGDPNHPEIVKIRPGTSL